MLKCHQHDPWHRSAEFDGTAGTKRMHTVCIYNYDYAHESDE